MMTKEQIHDKIIELRKSGKTVEEIVKEQQTSWEQLSIEEHMAHYESQGVNHKEAMKLVAKDRGVSKRDIYQYLVK